MCDKIGVWYCFQAYLRRRRGIQCTPGDKGDGRKTKQKNISPGVVMCAGVLSKGGGAIVRVMRYSVPRVVAALVRLKFGCVDKSPKVYTQLAREGVVLTQDSDNI